MNNLYINFGCIISIVCYDVAVSNELSCKGLLGAFAIGSCKSSMDSVVACLIWILLVNMDSVL